jgi:hypothetical protein
MNIDEIREYISERSVPEPNTGCQFWLGAAGVNNGYGNFSREGKTRLAHRMAWECAHGPIPDGMEVCHRCDQPLCVNHKHLFLGTRKDNMRDCASKGRTCPQRNPNALHSGHMRFLREHPELVLRGEQIGNSKLRALEVTEIRRLHAEGRSARSLAKAYGVSRPTISRTVKHLTWRHLNG